MGQQAGGDLLVGFLELGEEWLGVRVWFAAGVAGGGAEAAGVAVGVGAGGIVGETEIGTLDGKGTAGRAILLDERATFSGGRHLKPPNQKKIRNDEVVARGAPLATPPKAAIRDKPQTKKRQGSKQQLRPRADYADNGKAGQAAGNRGWAGG